MKFSLWTPDGPEVVGRCYGSVPDWVPCEHFNDKTMSMYLDFCDKYGEEWSAWLPLEVDE